jgi:hypothetical protein
MFRRRIRFSNACLATLFAFLLGACAMGWLVTPPPSDSRALRLPDEFATSADTNASNDYIAFFVGDTHDLVWGEVAVPPDAHKNGVLNAVYYTDLAGTRLMHADVSAADGWHHFQVFDWNNKVVAYINSEDAGELRINITDPAGSIMAQGVHKWWGEFDLHSPEGVPLATIFDAGDGNWTVSVKHCSKISKAIYALFAGYHTVVSTGRAKSV